MSEETKIIVPSNRFITPERLKSGGNFRAQINMESDEKALVYGFAVLYLDLCCPEWWARNRDKRADLVYGDNVGFLGELSLAGHAQRIRSVLYAAFPIHDADPQEAAANRDLMERCAALLSQDGVNIGVKKKK